MMEKVKKNINNSLVTFSCDFGSMYDMDNQVRSKFSCSTYLWSNMIQHQKKRPLHKREPQILLGQSGAGAATRYRVAPQHYRFQVLRIRIHIFQIGV